MRLVKYLLTVAVLITLSLNISKADTYKPSKESDIKYQFKQEIKHMMMLPVYLKFEDKNLTGEATVVLTIKNNGKIVLTSVIGDNKQLNSYVESKVNAINAWTSKEFAGKTFTYKIDMN